MSDYRMLALDLDGTLLTEDKTITANTKYWIRQTVEAGVAVIFATGRGFQTASPYWEELGLSFPMVFANGAEIWKGPGRLWKRHFIPAEEIRKLHALAVAHDAWFWGYSTEGLTGLREWSNESFRLDWLKFGIRHDAPDVLQKMREIAAGWGTVEITRSAPNNLEFSAKGITKESGVREVCGLLGIGMDEVIAVGDSMNDVRLLAAAGLGVAMGNADDTVKSFADVVTDSNENEGVANVIRRYLLTPARRAGEC